MEPTTRSLYACVVCNHAPLTHVADFGSQALANELFISADYQHTYSLSLYQCANCSHIQLGTVVKPEKLFSNYVYQSGTSASLKEYFAKLWQRTLAHWQGYDSEDAPRFVIDIGSNDGSLLSVIKEDCDSVLGIDPNRNGAAEAARNGIATVVAAFDERIAEHVVTMYGRADIIFMLNVLGHTANPVEMIKAAKKLLRDDGLLVIQTSQAHFIRDVQPDCVYHEHISYFNPYSMVELLTNADMHVEVMTLEAVHGGSLCVFAKKGRQWLSENTKQFIKQFEYLRQFEYLCDGNAAASFVSAVDSKLKCYVKLVNDHTVHHRHIMYGVSAKSAVWLQLCNTHSAHWPDVDWLNASWLPAYAVDDGKLKQGGTLPGFEGIEVKAPDWIAREPKPLLITVGAWNCLDEIMRKVKSIRNRDDDKFIVWNPEVKVI